MAALLAVSLVWAAAARGDVAGYPVAPAPGSALATLGAGPALAGGHLAWVENLGPRGNEFVQAVGGGYQTTALPAGGMSLTGSPDALVATLSDSECDRYGTCQTELNEILAGPPGGPLTVIDPGCSAEGYSNCTDLQCNAGLRWAAPVDGGVLFTPACGSGAVEEYRPGESTVIVPGVAHPISAAGHYVLLASGVFDLDTGQLAYPLAIPADSTAVIEADGTVAATLSGASFWASAASPTWHSLPLPAGARVLALAAGRVLYETGAQASSTPVPPLPRLGLAALDGTSLGGFAAQGLTGQISFDGAELAWAARPCAETRIYVADIGSFGQVPNQAPVTCPAPAIGAATVRAAHGEFAVPLTCPSIGDLGCAGTLRLIAAAPSAHPRRGAVGERALADAGYRVAAGTSGALTIQLTARDARFLAAHRVTTVSATATAMGSGYQPPEAVQRSHATFRLIASGR